MEFDFDDAATLAAGTSVLVLSFDPTNPQNASRVDAFRIHYSLDSSVALTGGYSGQLDDHGERVELERPDAPPPGEPSFIPHVTEDEFQYDNRVPWLSDAEGTGNSLQRRAPVFYGNRGQAWVATVPAPGTVDFGGNVTGDFTGDGIVAADDIDVLFDAIQAGTGVAYFDLDGSTTVDDADVAYLLAEVLHSLPGDANLDGVVDGSDFNVWNDNKFFDCGRSWSDGDFSGDGLVDASDFNIWFGNRFQSGPAAAPSADDGDARRVPQGAAGGENRAEKEEDNDLRYESWQTSSHIADTIAVRRVRTATRDQVFADDRAGRVQERPRTHVRRYAPVGKRNRGSLQRGFRDTSTAARPTVKTADNQLIDAALAELLAGGDGPVFP